MISAWQTLSATTQPAVRTQINDFSNSIIDLKTKSTTELNFGLEVCTILPGANEGYDINEVVLFVNTPFQYNVAYRYNFLTKILTKIQEPKLTGEKFDESQYKAHIV